MRITTNSILLASGAYFNYERPWECPFTICDIAHGLANTCRFTGQVRNFYSVAEHSIRVAALLPEHEQLAGLLHDASEAFCCDIPKPLKNMLPGYREIEQRVTNAINVRFQIEYAPSVHKADMVLMATERRDLLPPDDSIWPCLDGVDSLPDTIFPMTAPEAEASFLRAFHEITETR